MKLPAFDYACPTTLAQAADLLAAHGEDAKIIAGGQSLLPMLAFRLAKPTLLIDLRKLHELRRIDISERGVVLGAMTRWRDIENDARLREAHPLLCSATAHIAHYQIRNRGTVGGSLAHADPAAELPGIVVACEADIEVIGPSGARVIAAADFFLGPLMTALQLDEIIVAIHLPAWPRRRRYAFQEFSRRRGDFALAAVALFYDLDSESVTRNAHVGIVGVEGAARRLTTVEAFLNDCVMDAATPAAAEALACASVEPLGDLHATPAYRRALTGVLVERALQLASH